MLRLVPTDVLPVASAVTCLTAAPVISSSPRLARGSASSPAGATSAVGSPAQVTGQYLGVRFVQQEAGAVEEPHQRAGVAELALGEPARPWTKVTHINESGVTPGKFVERVIGTK